MQEIKERETDNEGEYRKNEDNGWEGKRDRTRRRIKHRRKEIGVNRADKQTWRTGDV